jgi:diguanylate cyclase (GGDEF)-like protein
MVSRREYLNRNDSQATLRDFVSSLIEKMGASAVAVDRLEYAAFVAEIERIREGLAAGLAPEALMVVAGSATQALERYNGGVTRLVHKQGREMQSIIKMVAETVVHVGGENSRSVKRLQEIGDEFERAGAITDLQALRGHLSECLRGFREEVRRQKELTDNLIAELRKQIESTPVFATETQDACDPATGLVGKGACLRAMQDPVAVGKRRYVVTMSVNRMQSINARFGHDAGDRILKVFADFITHQLNPADRVYRWTGPALVALIERSETLDRVRDQIRRIMEMRLDENLDLEGRAVLIPVSSAWSVFQLSAVTNAERQIQVFIASQGNREFV